MTTRTWQGSCATADQTRLVGSRIADLVEAGDLVVLSGRLGAGKTTLIQGMAAGLGARTPVTSPTFVLAREVRGGRLPLVHVDAYRLTSALELDDLDLDTDLDDAVVAVEWGEGIAEQLSVSRLEVRLSRGGGPAVAESDAAPADRPADRPADGPADRPADRPADGPVDETRLVRVSGVGPRWAGVDLGAVLAGQALAGQASAG